MGFAFRGHKPGKKTAGTYVFLFFVLTTLLLGSIYIYYAKKTQGDISPKLPAHVVVIALIMLSALIFALVQNEILRKEKEKILESETKLRESELFFKTVFDRASIGIAVVRSNRFILSAFHSLPTISPVFEQITGRTKEELAKLSWEEITWPDDLPGDLEYYAKFKTGQISCYDREKRIVRPDGTPVWVHMIISRRYLNGAEDLNHLCVIQDISKRKEQELKIKYISEHDMITGLYNRRRFEETLLSQQHIRPGSQAALLLSLQDFNLLNLTHSYLFSENLALQLTNQLSELCGHNCRLFAISFARFVFYVRDYESDTELEQLCRSILDVAGSTLSVSNIRGSIGIVVLGNGRNNPEDVLKSATIAAEYAAEYTDERFCHFDSKMEERIDRREKIKTELSGAAENEEDGRLYLEYQPVIDSRTGQIDGFEALARFNSNSFGPIDPEEFIPIAEDTQLIVSLGRRTRRSVCRFLKRLAEEGYGDTIVSFNLSGAELFSSDFLTDLIGVIEETGIRPSRLAIEITESNSSKNFRELNERLQAIKKLGIVIAMDDFGTGYSSFYREREMRIDCLKIDRHFIKKLLDIDADEAITGDIISMAHRLGHFVVAEGVEHERQKEYLMAHQCDYMQGYLFSKPLSAQAAIELLREQDTTPRQLKPAPAAPAYRG